MPEDPDAPDSDRPDAGDDPESAPGSAGDAAGADSTSGGRSDDPETPDAGSAPDPGGRSVDDPAGDPADDSNGSTDHSGGDRQDDADGPGDAGPGDRGGDSGSAVPSPDVDPGGWVRDYLRDHTVHAAVVALFAAYPFLYSLLTSVLAAEFTTLLPSVNLMVTVLLFGLFAMSFDFISGYTGYLSFGHAVFYGIGAYFVVLAANDKVPLVPADAPFLALLVLGGLLAAVAALLIGAVSFRLSGVYFAMITLGFSQVAFVFVSNWGYVGSEGRAAVTGRPDAFNVGVPYVDALNVGISSADFIGDTVDATVAGQRIVLSSAEVSFFAVGAVVLLCYLAMQRIVHSPFGKVMIAIRENEERARALGYNTYWYKMGAFALSAFFAAVAGGLFAGYTRAVSPTETLYFLVAGDALLAAIIGGFGTLAGALFGWLLFESLNELLQSNVVGGTPDGVVPYLQALLGEGALETSVLGADVRTVLDVLVSGRAGLYVGIVFVLFVLYVPDGVLGTIRARLGGHIAKRVPDRLFGPRSGESTAD